MFGSLLLYKVKRSSITRLLRRTGLLASGFQSLGRELFISRPSAYEENRHETEGRSKIHENPGGLKYKWYELFILLHLT